MIAAAASKKVQLNKESREEKNREEREKRRKENIVHGLK
jgi:hypothetical protein